MPLFMRQDHGREFVRLTSREWIASAGTAPILNDPGKPGGTLPTRASAASSATNACQVSS